MPDLSLLIPDVPPELEYAAQAWELVAFVGAGISRLIKCPSWDGFADKVLNQLVPDKIDYYTLSQINKIEDARKRLSIAKIIAGKTGFEIDYASTPTRASVISPNFSSGLLARDRRCCGQSPETKGARGCRQAIWQYPGPSAIIVF